jgi:hypothetical protein
MLFTLASYGGAFAQEIEEFSSPVSMKATWRLVTPVFKVYLKGFNGEVSISYGKNSFIMLEKRFHAPLETHEEGTSSSFLESESTSQKLPISGASAVQEKLGEGVRIQDLHGDWWNLTYGSDENINLARVRKPSVSTRRNHKRHRH